MAVYPLTAVFDIELPQPPLVFFQAADESTEWPTERLKDYELSLCLEEAEVRLRLRASTNHASRPAEGGRVARASILEVRVTRQEQESPPGGRTIPSQAEEFRARCAYFDQRAPSYIAVARAVAERLLGFLRFQNGQVGLGTAYDLSHRSFQNPVWLDSEGQEVHSRTITFEMIFDRGAHEEVWWIRALEPSDREALKSYLQRPSELPSYRQILAAAKEAALTGELSRAVVETAMAAEIALKRILFTPSTPAAGAIEHLEQHGKFKPSMEDLLKATGGAFGTRFHDAHGQEYQDILQLYKGRGRIVHHGVLEYPTPGASRP